MRLSPTLKRHKVTASHWQLQKSTEKKQNAPSSRQDHAGTWGFFLQS